MGGRPGGAQPHPVLLRPPEEYLPLEERIAHNRREIQVLLSDHREMSATHVALKQDLSLADQQLRQLSSAARQVRDDRESRVKELFERSVSLESQFRGVESLTLEHSQVVEDVKKLTESKLQLAAELKAVDAELQRVKSEASEVSSIKGDLDNMRQELTKGRAAVEFEKKTRAANLQLYEAMERKTMSMRGEIDRLRAELAHAGKRARAAAAATSNSNPAYMANYASPNLDFGRGPFAAHYSMHQAAPSADGASPAVDRSPASTHNSFDLHQTYAPRG